MLTFKQASDRVIIAYLQDKLNPHIACACWVGNLLNGHSQWAYGRLFGSYGSSYISSEHNALRDASSDVVSKNSDKTYTLQEVVDMENNFLKILHTKLGWGKYGQQDIQTYEGYEDALFEAMASTLDLLKQIHISKGENVNEVLLTKRLLNNAEVL